MELLQRILFPLSKTTGVESSTSNNDTDDIEHWSHHQHNHPHEQQQQRQQHRHPYQSLTPTTTLSWEGISPLEMTEKIATMVLQRVPNSRHRPHQIIDPSFLASKTPEIPAHVPPELPPLPTEVKRRGDNNVQRGTIDHHMSSLISLPLSTVSFDHDEQQQLSNTSIVSSRKRERRPSIGYNGYGEEPPIPNDTFYCNDNDNSEDRMLEDPWDLSYLITNDPDPHIAIEAVEKILTLARRLESMPGMDRSLPSYRRLRWDVSLQSKSIFGDDWCNEGGVAMTSRRSHLDQLYRSTREKTNALIVMTERMNEKTAQLQFLACPTRRLVEPDTAKSIGDDHHHLPSIPNHHHNSYDQQPPIENEYSKKEFTEYMNCWLKQNWTNPYPDDEGLADIALFCGTTITIVSNWLINARTRKWRPAIIQAYDNERPAELLHEDSIRIFEGKKLMEL